MLPGAGVGIIGNLVLIGMPGAGKSAVGRVLARALHRELIDTDEVLARILGKSPGELLASVGRQGFRALEEKAVLGLRTSAAVIATGGSVVYSPRALAHLRAGGIVIYLEADVTTLQQRGVDFDARGVLRAPGQDLASLLGERAPLYERCADVVLNTSGYGIDEVAQCVLSRFARPLGGR